MDSVILVKLFFPRFVFISSAYAVCVESLNLFFIASYCCVSFSLLLILLLSFKLIRANNIYCELYQIIYLCATLTHFWVSCCFIKDVFISTEVAQIILAVRDEWNWILFLFSLYKAIQQHVDDDDDDKEEEEEGRQFSQHKS